MTWQALAGIPITSLFVHGAGGGGWEWGVWQRVFAAHDIASAAPDLEPASAGLAATRFADYRDQVLAHARAVQPAQAGLVLVGASLGGLLALSVAHEARAAALVLVNPVMPAGIIAARPPAEPYPAIIPWGRERSLSGTRRAMPDADSAAVLHAFRNWRDESGAVLGEARQGIAVEPPHCPILVLSSEFDDDIPPTLSRALAVRHAADFERLPGCSHLGPLLGRRAAVIAERTLGWLRLRLERPD